MLDRKLPPEYIQDTTLSLLKPDILILDSGCKLVTINGGDQEVIKLEFIMPAGKWYEKAPGISHFTSNLFQKGTSKYDSFEIDKIFDFNGVHIETHSGLDFASVALYGLVKNLTEVLKILLDIFLDANFPQHELDQAKDTYNQGLKINLEKTSFIASRSFRKNLFGESHPYGYDIEFSNVENIQRNQLIDFHDTNFSPFFAVLSGKVSTATKDQIINLLGELKVQKLKSPQHITIPAHQKVNHIDKQQSIQTSIRIGQLTIGRSHQQYPELLLCNHILGGYFGSRLMKNIREEKGLTYGIHSSIISLKEASYWVIGTDVNSENKELSINEIFKEINKLQNSHINQEEIDIARNHFLGSLQSELTTPFAHAEKSKIISLFNLNDDYYQILIDKMLTLKSKQLLDFVNQYIHENEIHVVTVG